MTFCHHLPLHRSLDLLSDPSAMTRLAWAKRAYLCYPWSFLNSTRGLDLVLLWFFWSGIVGYQTTKQQKFQTVWFMIYIDLWYATENVLGNIMKYLDQRVDFETKKILQSKHLIWTIDRRRSGNLQADAPKGHRVCPWSFATWWIEFCWSSWKVV